MKIKDMEEIKKGRGGARVGAGRKKIEGGKRRFYTVPPDVDVIIQKRGNAWLWELVRQEK